MNILKAIALWPLGALYDWESGHGARKFVPLAGALATQYWYYDGDISIQSYLMSGVVFVGVGLLITAINDGEAVYAFGKSAYGDVKKFEEKF